MVSLLMQDCRATSLLCNAFQDGSIINGVTENTPFYFRG